jgi:hypothetical protein
MKRKGFRTDDRREQGKGRDFGAEVCQSSSSNSKQRKDSRTPFYLESKNWSKAAKLGKTIQLRKLIFAKHA